MVDGWPSLVIFIKAFVITQLVLLTITEMNKLIIVRPKLIENSLFY
jgi:hypothetical protein